MAKNAQKNAHFLAVLRLSFSWYKYIMNNHVLQNSKWRSNLIRFDVLCYWLCRIGPRELITLESGPKYIQKCQLPGQFWMPMLYIGTPYSSKTSHV